MTAAWLVAIDLQHVFADPASPWAAPDYATAATGTARLWGAFAGRTVLTRFVAPRRPTGAWAAYYAQWPFALTAPDAPQYALSIDPVPPGASVVSATTFGKWGPDLAAATGNSPALVLTGVSTDCCVLSTALAAADAGVAVRVVSDACAGASAADHERALALMALYAPLIEIVTVDEVLAAETAAAAAGVAGDAATP